MDKKALKEFNEYAKKFDFKDKGISLKFHHTYRVVEYAKEIAQSLNVTKEDLEVIELCALLHDISRFKQWEEYQTYSDKISFDHGDMGCEILLKDDFISRFTPDKHTQDMILKSTKNHNKYEIDKTLNEREKMITNIIRDADKLDILIEQYYQITDGSNEIKDELFECIKDKRCCNDKFVNTETDGILRAIGFIFDINYSYAYKILLDKKTIENKFNLLKVYTEDKRLDELEKDTINYMKEMIKC